MAKSVFRTVLVIGDNHEEMIKKYSSDTKVEMHVKYRLDDAGKMKESYVKLLTAILESEQMKLTESQRENFRQLYIEVKDMSDFDYYVYRTLGYKYDEETGDVYTDENPDAKYRNERCYEKRLKEHGEEGPFSNPFWLNDATKSYSARYNDICWERMHMFDGAKKLYERAWELVVNDDEPKDDNEKRIKTNMIGKKGYFLAFNNVEDYVTHSCSFWTYGVIKQDGTYEELTYKMSDREWVSTFYDKYIKTIQGNPLLTIYEVRSLND